MPLSHAWPERQIRRAKLAWHLLSGSGFPWHGPVTPDASPAGSALRRAGRRGIRERWPRVLRPFACVAMTLLWPFGSLLDAIRATRWLNPSVRSNHPRWRLARWAWRQALTRNVPPFEAIAYRLFEAGSPPADEWLYTHEQLAVLGQLVDDDAKRHASDKLAFADWCESLGIRCIPTLAASGQARWERLFEGSLPPECDLLLKPRFGAQAAGIEAWRWGGGSYKCGDRNLSPADFIAYVGSRPAMLVQALLAPHPTLQAIADRGMPAVRILTSQFPDRRIELGPALLQAPQAGAVVSQSGAFRLVDTDTGHVLPATPRQADPVFGSPANEEFGISALPGWNALVDMLHLAHARFPGRAPVLGWDVLFDAEGPLLCEVNTGISSYYFQFASDQPVASSPPGRAMAAWLRR